MQVNATIKALLEAYMALKKENDELKAKQENPSKF